MKIFHFKSKAEREAEKQQKELEDANSNPPFAEEKPPMKEYLVAIQWYDSRNITSEIVAGHNMYWARECIKQLYSDKRLNMDYGIVNIIEFK